MADLLADVDALVVGAGPVGLTMASELTRHGVSCRIIDKCAQATDKSKALVIWSRSLEMLDDMGNVEPFVSAGCQAHGASIYSGGKRLAHIPLDVDSPFSYALMIPQSETERLLTAHLSGLGVRVERQIELVAFTADDDGVTSTLRDAAGAETSLRTRWLLGCDGAHSIVRHTLGMSFTGHPDLNDWMLADIHLRSTLPADEISIFFHRDGVIAFFPIVGGRFRVIADLGPAAATDRPCDPTLEEVQRLIDLRGPQGLVATDPIWLAGFRINERKVANYRRGRVFLAGDAAHIHSPAGGQGMNTGMQDAYNLAWKLALVDHGHATDLLLESYSSERSAVGDLVLRNAGLLTKAATLRNPLAQQLRDHVYAFFMSFHAAQHRVSDSLTEMSINYRHSPLSSEHRGALAHAWLLGGGVPAGDRAPDAPLVNAATGQATTLHQVLRGTRHVLLLLAGADPAAELAPLEAIKALVHARYGDLIETFLVAPQPVAGVNLIDSGLALHKRYGAGSGTLYLIRPDGYVGYRSQPADCAGLLAHLQTYLR